MTRKKNMNKLNIPVMLLVLSCSILVSKYTKTVDNECKWGNNFIVEQVTDVKDSVVLASK